MLNRAPQALRVQLAYAHEIYEDSEKVGIRAS
jgi:hypothetical protein